MPSEAKNPVKSVETVLRIVDRLMAVDGAELSELTDSLDISKSTIHNYLSTLEQEEYVVKEGTEYNVGIRFLELGAYARARQKIYDIAKPEVAKLAEETGELANLLIEEHGRGSYLVREFGEDAVQVEAHVGTRTYLHSTALGKAILAHLPDERVDEIIDTHGLPEVTEQTVTEREALFDRLEQVRERGFALDDEERLPGLRCVAVPVLSNTGRVLGAVSVSGPTTRMTEERFREEVPRKVLETVNVIELNVTYS